MIKITTTVGFEEGLHARPASQLVKVCQSAKSDIKIIKGTTVVNPKSILGILTLGAAHNDVINIEVSGEDEEVVAQNLKDFFETV
jgi:phosphocarrier protein